jgi:hypothetical protein
MAKRTAASPPAPRKRATSKKANGSGVAPAAAQGPSAEEIRLRAYHRYLERGAGHGTDFDDWVEAEKDLKSTRS